jgi:hypothetical protein
METALAMHAAVLSERTSESLATSSRARSSRVQVALGALGAVAFYWALAILVQIHGHAYRAELTGYADEPSHYVTGLMVRDYVASGFPSSPFTFARDYYAHYPKIALGHWPPLFYMIEGAWMLVFGETRTSVLVLMALITGSAAALVAVEVRRRAGWITGALAGAIFVFIPAVQEQTRLVMIEVFLALLAFAAMIALGEYIDTENRNAALRFGVFTLLGILAKGNAWLLVIAAPLAVCFARKLHLLWRKPVWEAAAIIALAVPGQLLTMQLAREGWLGGSIRGYHAVAARDFALLLVRACGAPFFAFAALGFGAACFGPRRRFTGFASAVGALAVAAVLFHSLVPAGIEMRKLVIAMAGLSALISLGGCEIYRYLRHVSPVSGAALVAAAAVPFVIQAAAVAPKQSIGAGAFIREMNQPALKNAAVLVAGDSTFEGVMISEIAMRDRRPGHVVARASKLLASAAWNGADYHVRFPNAAQAMQYVDALPIQVIALEASPDHPQTHYMQLREGLLEDSAEWERWDFAGAAPGLVVFQRRHAVSNSAGRERLFAAQIPTAFSP